MKEAEMVVGKVYALKAPGKSRVRPATLISKMVMTSGRVLMRVEDPRGGPVEVEVPNRWVKPIGNDLPVAALELVKSDHFDGAVAWLPQRGEVVQRFDVPSLFWIVREVDIVGDRILVDGVLFGVRRKEWIPLERIHKAEIPARADSAAVEALLDRHGLGLDLEPGRHVRPAEKRSAAFSEIPTPTQIARRLRLGKKARTQYRWITSGKVRDREEYELRQEVRDRGRVCWLCEEDSAFLPEEYVRYVVAGRFAVVLFEDPSGDDCPIQIDRIYETN